MENIKEAYQELYASNDSYFFRKDGNKNIPFYVSIGIRGRPLEEDLVIPVKKDYIENITCEKFLDDHVIYQSEDKIIESLQLGNIVDFDNDLRGRIIKTINSLKEILIDHCRDDYYKEIYLEPLNSKNWRIVGDIKEKRVKPKESALSNLMYVEINSPDESLNSVKQYIVRLKIDSFKRRSEMNRSFDRDGGNYHIGNIENKNGDRENNIKKNITINPVINEYIKKYGISVCPHGTDKRYYCRSCHGDVRVDPSKKVIGICFDMSESMDEKILKIAKNAIIKVLKRIPTDGNYSVVFIVFSSVFWNNIEYIISLDDRYSPSIRDSAIRRIENIVIGGGSTPLYNSMNYFLDDLWPIDGSSTVNKSFPYTYLIVVSDCEDNGSSFNRLIYRGNTGESAFFSKLREYRDAGILLEIIPFAHGYGEDNKFLKELKDLRGKESAYNESSKNMIESMMSYVDSIIDDKNDMT